MSRPFPIMPPDRHDERQLLKARGIEMVTGVDWDMLQEHEPQAEANHGQSLRVLAERCGLSACEAVAVLENRQWLPMPLVTAYLRLAEIERAWKADRALLSHNGT